MDPLIPPLWPYGVDADYLAVVREPCGRATLCAACLYDNCGLNPLEEFLVGPQICRVLNDTSAL
jgi:hypothetical protein